MVALKRKIKNRCFDAQPHLEVARGTDIQNRTYCSKEGDFEERGKYTARGERTDLQDLFEATRSGKTDLELSEMYPSAWGKYFQAVERLRTKLKQDKGKKALTAYYQNSVLREWQKEVLENLDEYGEYIPPLPDCPSLPYSDNIIFELTGNKEFLFG